VVAARGCDGARFVCVPADRPRAASVAEAAVRPALPFVRSPPRTGDHLPLILLSAVAGSCTVGSGRAPGPADAVMLLSRLLERSTRHTRCS